MGRAGEILGAPLDPQRVLVVGDTPKDIAAAHAARAIAVGVASGHYSEEDLRKAGADHVLRSLDEDLPGTEPMGNDLPIDPRHHASNDPTGP